MTLAFTPPPCPDTWLRRLDARWKLAALLLAVIAVACLRQPIPAVVSACLACILAATARLPWRWVWLRLTGIALFVGPFVLSAPFLIPTPTGVPLLYQWGVLEVSESGVRLGIVIGCKALAIALLTMLIVATAPLDATLKAARALRIPGLLVQLTWLTYRYAVHLGGELKRLRIALRLRGFRQNTSAHSVRTMGRVMGAMLVRAHDRGERVSQAMQCRGFDGEYRSLTRFETRWKDVLFLIVMAAIAMVILVADTVK